MTPAASKQASKRTSKQASKQASIELLESKARSALESHFLSLALFLRSYNPLSPLGSVGATRREHRVT